MFIKRQALSRVAPFHSFELLLSCQRLHRHMVCRMVEAVRQQREELHWAMLWLMSYTFLLRMPSEARRSCSHCCVIIRARYAQALQTCKGSPRDEALKDKQTLIWYENGEVCIRILRRKNRSSGSGVLKRKCCCRGDMVDICPVHSLWNRFFCHLPCGAEPWSSVTPKAALAKLRLSLRGLGSTDAELYGTHDFRRGHAEARLRMHVPHLLSAT